MPSLDDAVTGSDEHVVITLDVSAGSKKDSFPAGYNMWRHAVVCQVAAPAVGGKANRAIIALVAETIGVPKSAVRIVAGAASTIKRIEVRGMAKDQAIQRLSSLLPA